MAAVAAAAESIVYRNVLAWRGCEQLYLNSRSSDVYFLFKSDASDSDKGEKVPAHKCILSAISPVFDAMFFGPHKQNGDIKIVDSNAMAFREFLQFFYLNTVKLTTENVPEVMYLGKEYMLNDCLSVCTDFCESTLTTDNTCWAYELAILFDQDQLRKLCERKICDNPKQIFQSSSFLACERNLLRHIMQLNALKCDESIVFDGCMSWARSACIEKGMDENQMGNLRAQLGNSFDEIRFGRMKIEQFYPRYLSYAGLFSDEEFKGIISKIAFKDFQPRSFNRNAHISVDFVDNEDLLRCNRKCGIVPNESDDNRYRFQTNDICDNLCIDRTVFQTNCRLLLKKFVCQVDFCRDNKPGDYSTEAKIRINEASYANCPANLLSFTEITLNNCDDVVVELSHSIEIRSGVKYEIEFEMETGITYSSEKSLKQVRMDHGLIVDFFGTHYKGCEGLVKCLYFSRCSE